MHDFEKGDFVLVSATRIVRCVEEVYDDCIVVSDDDGQIETYKPEELVYVPPRRVPGADVKAFFMLQISYEDMMADVEQVDNVIFEKTYLHLSDVKAMLARMADAPSAAALYEAWGRHYPEYCGSLYFAEDNVDELLGLPSERSLWEKCHERLFSFAFYQLDACEELIAMMADIAQYEANEKRPYEARVYSDSQKEDFIMQWRDNINTADVLVLSLYKRYIEELVPHDSVIALDALGYGCYGGNAVFPCDWETARDCMLKLLELDDDPFPANTLGYIYYYGRIDGQPDYAKAYYYFSIGEQAGVYESRYKIADMFLLGQGVPKNESHHVNIIKDMYEENYGYMMKGNFDNKFGDIAWRMGRIYAEGIGGETVDLEKAYFYYLQAEFAIRMRMRTGDYYGDQRVYKRVCERLSALRPTLWEDDQIQILGSLSDLYTLTSNNKWRFSVDLEETVDADLTSQDKLVFKLVPMEMEEERKWFVTSTDLHFCGYLETVVLDVIDLENVDLPNGVICDDIEDNALLSYTYPVGHIEAGYFTFRLPEEALGSRQMVLVDIDGYGYTMEAFCDFPVDQGDVVKIANAYSEISGTVMAVFERRLSELPHYKDDYARVVDVMTMN